MSLTKQSSQFGLALIVTVLANALVAGNAVSSNFLPKDIQKYVEDCTNVPLLPPGCQQLPEPIFIKELTLPNTSAKLRIEFVAFGDSGSDCSTSSFYNDSASGAYRISLFPKKETPTSQVRAEAKAEKIVSVLTQLSLGSGPDALITRVTGTPVLLLKAWTGGKCRNCDMSIVVSLDPRHMLDVVGKVLTDDVPDWKDLSGSGETYISVTYEGFEWYFNDNAWYSPSPRIFLNIRAGKLVPDKSKCFADWKPQLSLSCEGLNDEDDLREAKAEICFGILLKKLLIEYFMGNGNAACRHFQSGLKPLLNADGKLVLDPAIKKQGYSQEEIETSVRKWIDVGGTKP
jgi:hypothetical protein